LKNSQTPREGTRATSNCAENILPVGPVSPPGVFFNRLLGPA